MPKLPSLGDEPDMKYKLIHETFPLPGSRKELVRGVEQILGGGGVQKLVISIGQPIKVTRAVADDGMEGVPQELADDDIISSVRNVEMREYLPSGTEGPFEYLFDAFHFIESTEVDKARLQPKVFIVKKMSQLATWLNRKSVSNLFGVDVMTHKEVPEGALLFVAANIADIDEVRLSLKMEIDLPWRAKP